MSEINFVINSFDKYCNIPFTVLSTCTINTSSDVNLIRNICHELVSESAACVDQDSGNYIIANVLGDNVNQKFIS